MHQGSPLQPAGRVRCYDAPLHYWLAARLLDASPALLSCLAMQHEPSLQQVAPSLQQVEILILLYDVTFACANAIMTPLVHGYSTTPCPYLA